METVPLAAAAEQKRIARSERLAFIDWTRGAATLVMLQGHVWESFTHKDLRDTGVYMMSQFPGGVAPAVFLFLAGVTLAFLIDSRQQKGAGPKGRFIAAMRRAGYLGDWRYCSGCNCGRFIGPIPRGKICCGWIF